MKLKYLIHLIVVVVVALAALPVAPPAPVAAQTPFDCAAVSEIPQAECQALVALYNATDGPNWRIADGWLQTATPCSWFGVTCDAGHASQLHLPINNLNGTIPAQFSNLSELTTLDLHGYANTTSSTNQNHVKSIAPEFSNLFNLATLDLSGNELTALPLEFGNLSNLTHLNLGHNPIRLPYIGGYLVCNGLTSLPPKFGNLSNLTWLNLGCNSLTALPSEFGNLSNLNYLDLSLNDLTALPPEFGNLSNLSWLNLNRDSLTTLPSEFGNLSNLTYLALGYNALTALPPEFSNLSNLTELNLHGTYLTALPPQFGDLDSLAKLYLDGDMTTLPPEFGNLSNLITLTLSLNHLATLPPEFGNLTNLTTLELDNYALTTLPPEFGNLSNLSSLSLNGFIDNVIFSPSKNTSLTTLPPEFGNLSNLSKLQLVGNASLDVLPPELGNLSNLTFLNLDNNALTSLPPEFGNLSNLSELDLGDNDVTVLPPEFGNLSDLSTLNLSYNDLTALPPEFGNLSNLSELYLQHNALTSLPPGFGNLSNLSYLSLWGNSLASLPPEFGNLSNLSYLDLSYNPLQGQIPAFMTGLTSLSVFHFGDTEWCIPTNSPVPEWLANIQSVSESGLVCNQPPTTLTLSPAPELYTHIGAPFTATVTPVNVAYPVTFTWDAGDGLQVTTFSDTPDSTSWLYWNALNTHTLTVTAANAYSSVTATQTVSIRPISATVVLPDAPARLTYTDTHGSPTTLDLPTGSVSQPAALLFWPQPDPAPIPAWRPAAHSFALDLYRDGRPVPNPTFTNPLTLTLHYTDTDLAGIDRPNDLQLMRRDPDGWQPAACGPVSHDLDQHSLSLPICQLGDFALFGPATLTKFVAPAAPVENGSTLTYTLVFSNPEGSTLRLFDPLSPTLAWLGFVAPPPAGITFSDGALSGTLTLSPTHPLSLSFTVRVQLPEFAFRSQRSAVANTAFFCPTDANPCILHPSNTVSNPVFTAFIFLPLILRAP